jgi:pheromone receptor transcription factor
MSTAAGAHQYQGMQQPHGGPSGVPPPADLSFQHEDGEEDDVEEDDDAPVKKGTDKKAGRRKIKIEFINDKSRRHITFSKRKAGIMKKVRAAQLLHPTAIT